MNIVCFYGFVYDGLPVETCESLRVVFVSRAIVFPVCW